jgi:hypothetical protein
LNFDLFELNGRAWTPLEPDQPLGGLVEELAPLEGVHRVADLVAGARECARREVTPGGVPAALKILFKKLLFNYSNFKYLFF